MSPAARSLRPYLARQWKALAGAAGATGVLTAADLAKPWPLAIVVDQLLVRSAPFELDGGDWRLLAAVAVAVLAIALAEAGARYLSDLWLQSAGERIAHELRIAVYEHLQAQSLAYHQRRQKGDLLTRVTGDVNSMGDLFASSVGAIAQAVLLAAGMTVVLLVIDPVLALVTLSTMPLLAALSFLYRRRVRTRARERRKHEGRMASIAGEALSAMSVVKAFGSERYESDRVREGSERRMAIGVEVARLQARFDGLVGAVRAVGTALVLVVGVMRVAAGAIGPGELIVFVSYTRKAHTPLRSLARETTKVAAAMARAERVAEVLAADEALEERPGAYAGGRAADEALEERPGAYAGGRAADEALEERPGAYAGGRAADEALEERPGAYAGGRAADEARPGSHAGGRAAGEVVLDRVSFRYATERPALHDVSVRIPAGRCVALVGPSGAGKSTLAALVARLSDPTSGRVLIDGRDARDCSLAWLRAQVAILLQDTVLFSGTVRENIGYAIDADAAAIEAAARAAAAHDFIVALPRGYDTELGPQGVGLSGGQRQRIGIARTLLRDPPILLLDEPTTALDEASEGEVLEGLRALMRGRTTLLITHSPRLARMADRVVRLDGGRIARRATPAPPLEPLLDPEHASEALARSLGDGSLTGVTVSRVVYKPDELVAVHYRALIGGVAHDAVATRVAGADLAAIASKPRYRELARKASGRAPAREPVAYDEGLDALISWLPFDPRLPALAEPSEEIRRRLEGGGEPFGHELELVGYKPRGRAVLRMNGLILKAYGRERQFRAAVAGLRGSAGAPLRTAAFAGALPELRLTAQRALPGAQPAHAAAVAGEAGQLVAALQRSSPGDLQAAGSGRPLEAALLQTAGPERLLEAAERKAAVLEAVLPPLGPRLDRLVRRLGDELPAARTLVPAHGDFHVDQLLIDGDEIAVVDFDGMCLAPPALDLATYAADVVRGRDGDLANVHAVLDPLLAGYGARPDALEWHLAAAILGRAAHPFQRQVRDWPARAEAMVATAEATLG